VAVSELPNGVEPAEPVPPRDSASAVLLRPAEGRWEILLGLRSRASTFMPGHLACPGGTVEAEDGAGEPAAWVRCVRRELREEAGLDIPASAWREAGERVTPPIFPVRFRNRFFLSVLEREVPRDLVPASAENAEMRFASPERTLSEWASGGVQLPPPVVPILRVLAEAGGASAGETAARIAAANREEERAPRIEFAPDVWMLPVRTATLPPATHTNVWLPGGADFAIVDPGSDDDEELRRLLAVIERRRALGSCPLCVLLTHHHRDHVAGAAAVAAALGLPVRAHARTLDAVAPLLGGVERRPVADGEAIDLGGLRLEALATPGHAPGHLAFLLAERRALLAGDLVSGVSTILIDPEHGDMDEYLGSLARVGALGCRQLLPAHGPPLPAAHVAAVIEHRRERERLVRECLAERPRELAEIAREAYADSPRLPAALRERQALAHLLCLERRGAAARADDAGRRWVRMDGRRA
jgi:glyoxylase-like metal-dependent hydrolase (beta-lactamase superfamily II)/8-oxo-dGTP pyrophosphatase MutT (NUDIX family)